jgi:hypothetical protein
VRLARHVYKRTIRSLARVGIKAIVIFFFSYFSKYPLRKLYKAIKSHVQLAKHTGKARQACVFCKLLNSLIFEKKWRKRK